MIWFTRRALRELDRRNAVQVKDTGKDSVPHFTNSPAEKPLLHTSADEIARVSCPNSEKDGDISSDQLTLADNY